MSKKSWIGGAAATTQVNTWLFAGTWEANDVVNVTIGTRVVSVVAGSTTASVVAANVQAALAASELPEFTEITWTVNSATITGTAVTAGFPFIATFSTTETGGGAADAQTINGTTSSTGTVATACTGPNHGDNAQNWSGGTLPVDNDDFYFADSNVSLLFGLNLSTITPASITIEQSFTGEIGLPVYNANGGYYEYRSRYLRIGNDADNIPTVIAVGTGEGAGSSRAMIDSGDSEVTLIVLNTGPASEGEEVAFFWKSTHADSTAVVSRGLVGIAVYPGEVATVDLLKTGYVDNEAGDALVICGEGVTLGDLDISGGVTRTNSAFGDLVITGGELIHDDGACNSIQGDGGFVRWRSTNTGTTLEAGSDFTMDFRQDMRGRTFTNINLHEGCIWLDPFGTVTPTNGYNLVRCTWDDITFVGKPHQNWTPSPLA